MSISSITMKTLKVLFKSPAKDSKIRDGLPLAIGLGYSGINLYKAMNNIKNNNDLESKKDTMEAYVGMAIAAGSIFGFGGAALAGAGMKILCDKAKKNLV